MRNKFATYNFVLLIMFFLFSTSLKTSAQNYLISFTASGSFATIDSVKIENLTQGTSLIISGNDVLHLTSTLSIYTVNTFEKNVTVSPNPMQGQAELSFFANQAGNVQISINDALGKTVMQVNENSSIGIQKYLITDLTQGLYFINIIGVNYSYSAKLISQNTNKSNAKIKHIESHASPSLINETKSTQSTIDMQYNAGNTLRYTGYSSGCYIFTIDVPTMSKTVNLTFTAGTLPTITTTSATSLTWTTATSGGNISADGGCVVSLRGICYSTSTNPTIANSILTSGSNLGSFISNITGLTPSTTYYVKAFAINNTGTVYGNQINFTTTAANVAIGDSYQGGIVAYILQSGDPGYNASVQHGLIVAPSDQSTGIQWCDVILSTTGATATALGTGNVNTNAIIANQGAGSYAAKLCADLVLGGYNDWYLPSKDELNKLYVNSIVVGGFASNFYWSSSEFDFTNAWMQTFNNGNQYTFSKHNTYYVRAVRSF